MELLSKDLGAQILRKGRQERRIDAQVFLGGSDRRLLRRRCRRALGGDRRSQIGGLRGCFGDA
jgi:hypothetical protein